MTSKHFRSRRLRFASPWPVDLWVPDEGWVPFACMKPEWLARSIEHADLNGDQHFPVSRWQGGLAGATRAGLRALVDFAPGPRDNPNGCLPTVAELVGEGLVVPTHTFCTGQRVFQITEVGRDYVSAVNNMEPRNETH